MSRYGLRVTCRGWRLRRGPQAPKPWPTPRSRRKPTPPLSVINGKIKLAGLHHPVNVLRDRWGVPHIYAQDQHDLFFAQGFVASQDRLFQMELWKRLGQGRLAEIFGPSMLERDVNARRLRYRGAMAAEYASYSPDTKEILEAFTEGINANIRSPHVAREAPDSRWNSGSQVFPPNLGNLRTAFCAWPDFP